MVQAPLPCGAARFELLVFHHQLLEVLLVFWLIVAALAVLVAAVYVTAYICYRMAFLAQPGQVSEFPEGKIYEPFYPAMAQWAKETKALPQERVSIKSFDGLT